MDWCGRSVAGICLFEREHHRRIARVLSSLNSAVLAENVCYFGGGTAIALRYGEYRKSVDIVFVVSDPTGYRNLRQQLTGAGGFAAITRSGCTLDRVREIRGDQYGIRTMLMVDSLPLKFEIVREARVVFETPSSDSALYGVATLTPLDMATSKLLANSDRWADDGTHSRDLIDLAMMALKPQMLRMAITKAAAAYGTSIETDLIQAITRLGEREHRLERCLDAMKMTVPRAKVWHRIKALLRTIAPATPLNLGTQKKA